MTTEEQSGKGGNDGKEVERWKRRRKRAVYDFRNATRNERAVHSTTTELQTRTRGEREREREDERFNRAFNEN
jgi:hypothetical protein